MSVGSGVPYNSYTGNGVSTVFAFGFTLLDAADLVVTISGVVTSSYTVSGLGVAAGGSITFSSPPANGAAVLLQRVIQLVRATDYQDNGDFLADTANYDFDRLWMAVQQNDAATSRALRVPEIAGISELPAASDRAEKLQGYDASGNPIVVAPVAGTATALALDLVSTGTATKGPGQVGGPNHQLNYAVGTLGRHLVEVAALVTDYPWLADKTGATDAQPAIQACIDYWAAKGVTDGVIYRVRVPAGQYKLGAGIKTCGASTGAGQVGLVGDGIFATRFMPTGDFAAVNIVTSYVQSGGFSVHWAAYGGTTSRVGVELASANAQVSQCLISDILVQNAGRGFYLADWTGQPYGTVYLLTMANCLSISASDWGFYVNSKTGSTTLELSGCYVNGGNGSGVATSKGYYFNNINEVTGELAVDKCVDKWVEVVNANWAGLYIAAESCKLSTNNAVGITINADRGEIRGLKDISCTYDAVGTVRVVGMGAGCRSLILAGYSQQSATIGGSTTVYRTTLNAATSLLTIADDSITPPQAQDNGFHANVTYNGVRLSSLNTAPAYGTWPAGSMVRYLAPTVGGAEGAVTPAGGSPGTWYEFGAVKLQGSATYDPPSLVDGAGATTTVTVTGAALGDFAAASFSGDLQGITLTAWVSSANTVSVRFQNESGGTLDLGSGTLRARVVKQ